MSEECIPINVRIIATPEERNKLESLLLRSGLSGYPELFKESLSFLLWGIETLESGKEIAQFDKVQGNAFAFGFGLGFYVHVTTLRKGVEEE